MLTEEDKQALTTLFDQEVLPVLEAGNSAKAIDIAMRICCSCDSMVELVPEDSTEEEEFYAHRGEYLSDHFDPGVASSLKGFLVPGVKKEYYYKRACTVRIPVIEENETLSVAVGKSFLRVYHSPGIMDILRERFHKLLTNNPEVIERVIKLGFESKQHCNEIEADMTKDSTPDVHTKRI